MKFLLTVFGVFGVIGLIVCVLLVLVGFKLYFFFQGLKSAVEQLKGEDAGPPREVNLETDADVLAEASDALLGESKAFVSEGFEQIGGFTVEEIPEMRLIAHLHPALRLYGVAYEMAGVGVWSDVVALCMGGSITASSATRGTSTKERPGHRKVAMPGQPVSTLVAAARQEMEGREWEQLDAKSFVYEFERAYRQHMEWLSERGGPDEEEIVAEAKSCGLDATPEGIRAVQAQWQERRQP